MSPKAAYGNWLLGNAAKHLAKMVGLPNGAIVFILPSGRRARSDKQLGSLREDWKRWKRAKSTSK